MKKFKIFIRLEIGLSNSVDRTKWGLPIIKKFNFNFALCMKKNVLGFKNAMILELSFYIKITRRLKHFRKLCTILISIMKIVKLIEMIILLLCAWT